MLKTRPKAVPARKANAPLTRMGRDQRRGKRVNSRVSVVVRWDLEGQIHTEETQTRVVGPYGCLVVLPEHLDLEQSIEITNIASNHSNRGIVVWRGNERVEGWEVGIELINPQMDFWGMEL